MRSEIKEFREIIERKRNKELEEDSKDVILSMMAMISEGGEGFQRLKNSIAIDMVLPSLTNREQLVIRGIYLEGETIISIAKKLKVTRKRINEVRDKALRKLNHPTRLNKLCRFGDSLNIDREICREGFIYGGER